uniref:Uncharacterized protein n=1 Tax=Leersia perrieri TaxID=77586 RepID=A0A0D9VM95_9ORYZ
MAAAALGSDVVDEVDQPIIDARCVADEDHYGTTSRYCLVCCEVCSKICEKFGKHGLVKPKQTMRSLLTPLRMNKGMDEKVAPKKQADVFERPLLSSCDKAKIERKKRKDERQRTCTVHPASLLPFAALPWCGGTRPMLSDASIFLSSTSLALIAPAIGREHDEA